MRRIQTINVVDIMVSPLAIQRVPVRKHKDRYGSIHIGRHTRGNTMYQPSAYHLRIQKKWDKRFGGKDDPRFVRAYNELDAVLSPEAQG